MAAAVDHGRMRANAVLIPTYNSAATLRPTLESLLVQDLSSIDAVYLADDASSDATIEIARAVWQSPTPLIVIRQTRNQGERHNVNTAIRGMPSHLAWLHILHSDDLAKPQWLRAMTAQIDRAQPTVASICSAGRSERRWLHQRGRERTDKPAVHVDGSAESVRALKKGCWWHISVRDLAGGISATLATLQKIWRKPATGNGCCAACGAVGELTTSRRPDHARLHGASVSSASFRAPRCNGVAWCHQVIRGLSDDA